MCATSLGHFLLVKAPVVDGEQRCRARLVGEERGEGERRADAVGGGVVHGDLRIGNLGGGSAVDATHPR